eukprot:jgi/Psemu1/18327/gm1.18327_g
MPIKLTLGKGIMLEESSYLNLFTLMVLSTFMVLWRIDALYSPEIATQRSWYRWRQIKSNLNLNCNQEAKYNRLLLCKDGTSKFNYADKFDYIYETLACLQCALLQQEGGCSEVHNIFTKYVIPEIGKLWSSPSHLTADNFFNSDSILDWMGGLGLGMIGAKYFHKENVSSASGKRCACVARLCNPVTMVKKVPARAEAGRFTKGYRHTKSWKYCHAPINHAKALSVLTAFDIYQEHADGTHGPAWLLPKRQQSEFRQFKQKLSEQMLGYNPSDKAYPVSALLREVTQSSTKQRRAQSDWRRSCAYFFGGRILNYHCLETVFEAKLNGRFCLEFDVEEYK